MLDDLRAKVIIDSMREHGLLWLAAERAGVSRHTLYGWMERGHKGEEPYATLVSQCEMARGEHVAVELDAIRNSTDWRAKAWILERIEPAMRPASRTEVSGPDGGPVVQAVVATSLTEAQAADFRARVLGIPLPERENEE